MGGENIDLYTIGFTRKTAEEFFKILENSCIDLVLDIRLNPNSQLSGFAKSKDLKYFLKLFNINYEHNLNFAPTKELLTGYRKKEINWENYEKIYSNIVKKREAEKIFEHYKRNYSSICLLCSEAEADFCHRRLLAEYLKNYYEEKIRIIHL